MNPFNLTQIKRIHDNEDAINTDFFIENYSQKQQIRNPSR